MKYKHLRCEILLEDSSHNVKGLLFHTGNKQINTKVLSFILGAIHNERKFLKYQMETSRGWVWKTRNRNQTADGYKVNEK